MVIWGLTETFSRLNSLSQFRRKLFYFQSSISPSWFPGDVREQKEETITANFVSFLGFFWCVTIVAFGVPFCTKDSEKTIFLKQSRSERKHHLKRPDISKMGIYLTNPVTWHNVNAYGKTTHQIKGREALLFSFQRFSEPTSYISKGKKRCAERTTEKSAICKLFPLPQRNELFYSRFPRVVREKKSCDKDNNIDGTTKMIQTRLLFTLVGLS